MIEKVNPSHPDKVADRIAGALVDLAYTKNERPKIAVEVLIGHGICHIIAETSEELNPEEVQPIVDRIAGKMTLDLVVVPQDKHLSQNQSEEIRCGDNGIFKGVPLTIQDILISEIAKKIYDEYKCDGKYILDKDKLIICQSNAPAEKLKKEFMDIRPEVIVNPIGEWTGGTEVDSGATNRKLGSDMAKSVTGGGLHGKDLSKADVSVNIYAFLKAQETKEEIELCCAIGDDTIDGRPYREVVEIAKDFIKKIGGFEKFAEWGLF